MKRLAILGSTGSIGCSALAVVDAHPSRLKVVALAAGNNAARLADQARRYQPALVALSSAQSAEQFNGLRGGCETHVVSGAEGLVAVAAHPDVDLVICASSGTAALEAVLAAIEAGKAIALANKEVLVMAGQLVTEAAARRGIPILPVDSEHNAIHQCLHGRSLREVRRLVLTASGGPFRDYSEDALEDVDADAALKHPTWQMGRKITVDSATLMNKGLEVIEAHWLFGMPADAISVVIHPQSIVHSLVELVDGSLIAQLGVTDMRLPIQYACSYPDRWESSLPALDLTRVGPLEFHPPAPDRFPCLALAYRALRAEKTYAVVLNAANEVAVGAFLENRLGFTSIPRVIERTLDAHAAEDARSLDVVRRVDRWARDYAMETARGLELNQ